MMLGWLYVPSMCTSFCQSYSDTREQQLAAKRDMEHTGRLASDTQLEDSLGV